MLFKLYEGLREFLLALNRLLLVLLAHQVDHLWVSVLRWGLRLLELTVFVDFLLNLVVLSGKILVVEARRILHRVLRDCCLALIESTDAHIGNSLINLRGIKFHVVLVLLILLGLRFQTLKLINNSLLFSLQFLLVYFGNVESVWLLDRLQLFKVAVND